MDDIEEALLHLATVLRRPVVSLRPFAQMPADQLQQLTRQVDAACRHDADELAVELRRILPWPWSRRLRQSRGDGR